MRKSLFLLSLMCTLVLSAPASAKETQLNAAVSGVGILKVGKANWFTLKLTDSNGKPVSLDRLKEVHTQKIHLLVADQSLTDYNHLHPKPTKQAGSYTASFVPKKGDSYKIWVDVTPIGGNQQFISVPLSGGQPCKDSCVKRDVADEGIANGLKAKLSFDTSPKVGIADMGMVKITDDAGKPVTDLEPVMGAFAHIVGFYDDYSTVAHVHPMGKEPSNDKERGGPELSFHFEPVKAGFVKLYVQVRRSGQDIFIPLGVTVQ